jgi:hypothetical protein
MRPEIKKTGLISQGVTKKPGEFSNLVQQWDFVEHRTKSVPNLDRIPLGTQRTILAMPEIRLLTGSQLTMNARFCQRQNQSISGAVWGH